MYVGAEIVPNAVTAAPPPSIWAVLSSAPYSWPPLIASMLVALTEPAATLPMAVPSSPASVTVSLSSSSYCTTVSVSSPTLPATSSSWDLFTASVSSVPAATLVIWRSLPALPTDTLLSRSAIEPAPKATLFRPSALEPAPSAVAPSASANALSPSDLLLSPPAPAFQTIAVTASFFDPAPSQNADEPVTLYRASFCPNNVMPPLPMPTRNSTCRERLNFIVAI